jgi:acyl carrier protein
MDIAERIVAIIAERALVDPEDIQVDQPLDQLGIDSLGLVESIFAIEEEFDIRVPFNANMPDNARFDLTSVETITAAVKSLMPPSAQ